MFKKTRIKSDTNLKPALNPHYSLCEEKYSKEKAIAELDAQRDLAIKLLLKTTDVKQRSKLEAKKNDCLEKKLGLLNTINEIKSAYVFFHKGLLVYEIIEEFHSLFNKLLNTESEIDSLLLKKLEALQKKEESSIKLADCALSLKDVMGDLSYYDCNNLEKNIENFFNKIEKETKASHPNFFISHVFFCEKIFEYFEEIVKGFEGTFDLKKIKKFFQVQFAGFSIPVANHSLVGIIAILIYKTLFKFLKCKPTQSSLKKLDVYIKFHIAISSFSMENLVLHELPSMQKRINNLKYKFKEFLEIKKFSKCALGEHLKLVEIRYQELDSIKLFFKTFFKDKSYIQALKLLHAILKKEDEELLNFIKIRTGLDASFLIDKQTIYTMQSNKMFIKYFFSCIAKPSGAESLRKTVEYFISSFEVAIDCVSIDLMTLTNKNLLTLSHLAYFILIFFEFHIELERLEDKLINFKLSLLDISLRNALKKINTDIKHLEDEEKNFIEKTFANKNTFTECKNNLIDEFEFFLEFVKCIILQVEEMYTLQSKVSYAHALNNLKLSSQTNYSQKANLGEVYRYKLSFLIDIKNKFSVRQEKIKKHLLSENCETVEITKTKKISLEKKQVDVVEKLDFENLFTSITHITRDLCILAEYVEQPERAIIECNKTARKKNKFSSAIGRIRASTNLIISVFHELESNTPLRPNLVNTLELVKQAIEKNVIAHGDDVALNLFIKNIERCFLLVGRIHQEIIAVTNQYELHNSEIAKLLEKDALEVSATPLNFFRCDSLLKKINTSLKEKSFNLRQKIGCLKNVISAMGNTETSVINKFFSVIYQADEYEKIFYCIKQQNEALYACTHSFTDFPTVTDKDMQTVKSENRKLPLKSKKKRLQRKKLITSAENFCLRASDYSLFELRKFSEWSTGLKDWKQKRYSHLDNVFNTIEKCSFANLNKTATAFFKILNYYTKELLDKHQELKDQLSQLSNFFQASIDCVKPIKDFLLYSDQWFYNVLARLDVCKQYLLQSSKTYNAIIGNNSANAGDIPYIPVSQAVNSLLSEYLNYFIIYNKNNSKLLFEEKELAAINEEFVVKILEKDSLTGIEQEGDLLFQFNEKLHVVNQLNSVVKEAQEKKQKAKEELAQMVDPETLNFYLRRIDPSDMQILTNSSLSSIRANYAFAPSSSYFFTYDAANLNENNIDYKLDMEYHHAHLA